MANQDHLELIQQGVNIWNRWRNEHDIRPTLSEADLRGMDLTIADLTIADLTIADLRGADLKGADLREVDLRGADLRRANLVETTLSGTDLSNATVGNTIFGNVDLRMVKELERVKHWGPSTIGTDTLSLSEGSIPEVFLRGAGLSDSFIECARALTKNPIQYCTCFISYSSKDELFARKLHNGLQQEGVRCWFAPEDMDIGDKIKHRIEESIRLYDKLLLILSKDSIASNWVAYEVEQALHKEPQGVPNVLFPIRVDKAILTCTTRWAKDIQSTRHIGDFERWKTSPDKYQQSFERLLRALKTKPTEP